MKITKGLSDLHQASVHFFLEAGEGSSGLMKGDRGTTNVRRSSFVVRRDETNKSILKVI
jgi:hypothetical protein